MVLPDITTGPCKGASGQRHLLLEQSRHPKPLALRLPDLPSEHSGHPVKIEFLVNNEQFFF